MQRGLLNYIRGANFYAIMANETTDAAGLLQPSSSIRWVDDNLVTHEDPVPETTGEAETSTIKDALLLPLQSCQCRSSTAWPTAPIWRCTRQRHRTDTSICDDWGKAPIFIPTQEQN